MICITGLDLLQSLGEFPCAVCRTSVGKTVLCTTDACTGCTVSARGSSTFKRTQTTGNLDVKELPDPQIEDHGRGFRLTVVSDKLGQ